MSDETEQAPEKKRGPGRPLGSLTNRNRALARKLAEDEEGSPLAVMVRVMKEFLADADKIKVDGFPETPDGEKLKSTAMKERRAILNLAVSAAKDAAPFIHARLQTIQLEGTEDGPPIQTKNVALTKDELMTEMLARGLPLPNIET